MLGLRSVDFNFLEISMEIAPIIFGWSAQVLESKRLKKRKKKKA